MSQRQLTSGSLVPSPIALLVPKPMQILIADGDAEVVEKRIPGEKRFFVHLFDEVEREEVVRRRLSSQGTHERALAELRWARATLWNDEHLQRYLYTSDWLTWPSLQELASVVDLVCSAKETDIVPDFVGANSLKKALEIVRQEALYPGLHPLNEQSIAGPLVALKSTTGNGCTAGDTLHRVGIAGEQCIGSSVWVVEPHTPSFSADAVLSLPLATRVQKECVGVMQPALAASNSVGDSWTAVRKAHRTSIEGRGPGIFYSIPDYILQVGATAMEVARLFKDAAEQGRRVRLRVGVYLTLLQRNEVYVLMQGFHPISNEDLKDKTDGRDDRSSIIATAAFNIVNDGDEEKLKTSFHQMIGQSYDACRAAGLLLLLAEGETLEDALRLRFLSPLASAYKCVASYILTPSTRVTHVVVQHNPFAVIHGQRVEGTFPENREAREALSELVASREGEAQSASHQSLQQGSTINTTTTAAAASAATLTSVTLTGEQLRRGVDEALFKTLSQNPLTKLDLSAHTNLARFKNLPNFDAVLKDSLRRITEYRGRKYHLKE